MFISITIYWYFNIKLCHSILNFLNFLMKIHNFITCLLVYLLITLALITNLMRVYSSRPHFSIFFRGLHLFDFHGFVWKRVVKLDLLVVKVLMTILGTSYLFIRIRTHLWLVKVLQIAVNVTRRHSLVKKMSWIPSLCLVCLMIITYKNFRALVITIRWIREVQ